MIIGDEMYKKVNNIAKFVAIDANGDKCEYEHKPIRSETGWCTDFGDCYFISNASETTNWQNSLIEIDAQEKEPTAWNGEGLPPVGTVCEAINEAVTNPKWEQCTILFMGNVACVRTGIDIEERFAMLSSTKFRPIKTEREKVVELGNKALHKAINGNKTTCEALYDARMLKLPEGE